jgi:hypothetical protein
MFKSRKQLKQEQQVKEEVKSIPLTKEDYFKPEEDMFKQGEVQNPRTFTMSDGQVAYENQRVHLTTTHDDGSTTYSIGHVVRIFDQGFYSLIESKGIIATGFEIKDADGNVTKNNNGLHLQLVTLDGKPAYWEE